MRLGGPVFDGKGGPDEWVESVRRQGYRAALCPVAAEADDATVRAYVEAARKAGIVIAEVGAWSSPIHADPKIRNEGLDKCKKQLALADRVGARCCVNVAGSRDGRHSAPHPLNLTEETFDMIVACVREIIDAVKPSRACYALETMPWLYPDSVDNYLRLIEAIDRPQFAAHFDPVNLISSPQRYFTNADIIRDGFKRLGPYIRSCHAKDILLLDKLTTHLDEVAPGQGGLDYRVFLQELNRLDPDTPLMMEHLKPEQYPPAAAHIRSVAKDLGIAL